MEGLELSGGRFGTKLANLGGRFGTKQIALNDAITSIIIQKIN